MVIYGADLSTAKGNKTCMELKTLNGASFYEMLKFGYRNLSANYKKINDLNVFPVPDGDTGTNMKLTYANGLKFVTDDDAGANQIADEFARGMLFGARGNSGVLTSQYFRGFADSIKKCKEISVPQFAKAMVAAYKNAYTATVDVVEVTSLTVARESIDNVLDLLTVTENFESFLAFVVKAMKKSLDNTPNLLPVLKQNGVIDSGGKGLLIIFEGFYSFFSGKEIEVIEGEVEEVKKDENTIDYSAFNENSVLEFGYCTEFLLQLTNSKIKVSDFDINPFISYLQEHGESLVCFQTGTIVKVHVHTKKPYEIVEFAQRYGEFVSFKMENMALQHNSVIMEEEKRKAQERKKMALVAVAQGDGIIELFKSLGCDSVLNGGQTMNASVSEIIDAFKAANADEIILLPNESNMCKAAFQAADLYKDSVVHVIKTKTIPEGYFVLSMRAAMEGEENLVDTLRESLELVLPVTVFKSGKEAKIGEEIAPKGTYVEAIRHKLVGYKDNRKDAVTELLSKVPEIEDKSVCVVFYGQMMKEEEAQEIADAIQEQYPNLEVGLIEGKQDVYDLLIGLN